MPDDLRGVLRRSVEEVLEKMFFIRALNDASVESASAEECVSAHLSFDGDPPGSFSLSVTCSAARSISADFLGEEEDDLSQAQVGDVICELANMICGSVLSRIESSATFRLVTPQLGEAARDSVVPHVAEERATHRLELGCGILIVTVRTENPVCSAAEKPVS